MPDTLAAASPDTEASAGLARVVTVDERRRETPSAAPCALRARTSSSSGERGGVACAVLAPGGDGDLVWRLGRASTREFGGPSLTRYGLRRLAGDEVQEVERAHYLAHALIDDAAESAEGVRECRDVVELLPAAWRLLCRRGTTRGVSPVCREPHFRTRRVSRRATSCVRFRGPPTGGLEHITGFAERQARPYVSASPSTRSSLARRRCPALSGWALGSPSSAVCSRRKFFFVITYHILQGFSFADRTGAHSCCAIYRYKHFKWRLVGTGDNDNSSNG